MVTLHFITARKLLDTGTTLLQGFRIASKTDMLSDMVVVEDVRKHDSQGVLLIVAPYGLCYGSWSTTVVMTLS
jgi:hypothetical protein